MRRLAFEPKPGIYMFYSTLFLTCLQYCVDIHIFYKFTMYKYVIRHNAQRCDHTTPLLYKSRILKFTDLVQFRTVLFMYKANKNKLPSNIKKLFVMHTKKYCTRRQNHFFLETMHRLLEELCHLLYMTLSGGIL